MLKISFDTKPVIPPEPYWIAMAEPFALYVDDASDLYFVRRKQPRDVHFALRTQRLLDL